MAKGTPSLRELDELDVVCERFAALDAVIEGFGARMAAIEQLLDHLEAKGARTAAVK